MLKLKTTILLIGTAFFLTGCADLDETLRSDISADAYYTSVEGFEDLTVAMYQPLKHMYGDYNGTTMTNLGTDLFTYGSGGRPWINSYDAGHNPSATARNWYDIWVEFYRGINLANSVIDRADNVEGITEHQKTRWVAEAHFVRAHYYYILVKMFGGVHLTLEETTGVETEAHRLTEEEIWPVVIEDLEYAAEHLPEVQSQTGRATVNAAKQNLARVHLWLENWEEAVNWANQVIDSGQYSLIESYAELWDPYTTPRGEYNEETIWGHIKSRHVGGDRDPKPRRHAPRARTLPGVQATFYIGAEVSRYKPTEFFITEIFNNDPDRTDVPNHWNDERYQVSFKEVWYYNDPGGLPSGVAIGDTALYTPAAKKYQEMTDEEAAQFEEECNCRFIRIQDWTSELWTGMAYKFRHRGDDSPEQSLSALGWWHPDFFGRTEPIFRLGETYLIAAEAYMMMGDQVQAAEYFNIVRKRAEAPGHEIPLISPGELDIDEILNERARELAGEYHTWFDLKRTGRFLERIRAHNEVAAQNVQEYHMYRPIPQAQIDRTSNDYPQNPGY